MKLHEIFNMTENEIYDDFICLAIEKQIEYVFDENHYLYIKGKSKICLTSHVDTVDFVKFKKEIKEENGVIKAYRFDKQCILGADDRAGVFIIYEMFLADKIDNIMLFSAEELGGIGSSKFIEDKIEVDVDLFIALDASYSNRYIWYGNMNSYPNVFEFIDSFGYKNDGHGIFTDITILCEGLNKPGINLSVGYYNQHSDREYLDLESMYLTKRKVELIVEMQFTK